MELGTVSPLFFESGGASFWYKYTGRMGGYGMLRTQSKIPGGKKGRENECWKKEYEDEYEKNEFEEM